MYDVEIFFRAPDYILKRAIIFEKIIRSINSLPYNTYVGTLFKSLNVPKVNDTRYFPMSMRAFNFIGKQVFNTDSELHPYNTRKNYKPSL